MKKIKLLPVFILVGILLFPSVANAANTTGTLTLDLIPTNETQKLAAISELGVAPPDTGIERVEIVKLENKTETLAYSLDSLTSSQNISLTTGTYILKVKYKNQKGKWIVDGNGSGYHIESGGTIVVPLYSNTPVKDVLGDMPWAVENGKDIPVLLVVKDADSSDFYPVYKIYIYDAGQKINDKSDDILVKTLI